MTSPNPEILRRPKAKVASFGINIFHLRNPWVIAWWSLTYPGFGHIACGAMAKGIFLFIGEVIINKMANVNLAILFSFTGEFGKAKSVLNTQWLLLYCGVLVFAIWDSYRLAIECNKASVLGDRESAPITPTVIGISSFHIVDKRNPWIGLIWSMLVPGLGQLYNVATVKAIFLMLVSAYVIIVSHSLQALLYTAWGNFELAKAIIDWQTFINIPSFYGFAMWDSYVDSIEINKIFEIEQAQYFKNNFQSIISKRPLSCEGE